MSILEQYNQRLDLALLGIKTGPKEYINRISNRINLLHTSLLGSNPLSKNQKMQSKVTDTYRRLIVERERIFSDKKQSLSIVVAKLDGASPLNVLGRGYAYVLDPNTQKNIKSVRQVKVGSIIKTRLKDGSFGAKISSVNPLEPKK